jgi:AcrR family transcriptional regulator
VIEERGADSLSATAISLAVGASNAASYSHFPDGVTELIAAVATRGFDQLGVALGEASLPPLAEERVRVLFRRYVQFGLERSHLYRAMFSLALAPKLAAVNVVSNPVRGARTYGELMAAKARAYDAFENATQPIEAERCASGAISVQRGDAAKAVATLAHGLVLEFIEEGIDLGTTSEGSRMAQRLATASRLIEMLLHGVMPRRDLTEEANDGRG